MDESKATDSDQWKEYVEDKQKFFGRYPKWAYWTYEKYITWSVESFDSNNNVLTIFRTGLWYRFSTLQQLQEHITREHHEVDSLCDIPVCSRYRHGESWYFQDCAERLR